MDINFLHFECLNSTNTWSKENYQKFDPKKITLVTADQQTAGRGRYKRIWISPPRKNIYATFTFFMQKDYKKAANITQVTALSIVKTLKQMGFHSFLKWPNDIQINQKKVGGVLCEMIVEKNQIVALVGIGLNINMPIEILQTISQASTSLMAESGKMFQIFQVLDALQNNFAQDIVLFLEEGFSPFLENYRRHIIHKNGDHLVLNDQKGVFHSIDKEGALVMTLENAKKQQFFAGDVF